MPITQAQKEIWLRDLRSGEFAQGRGVLHSPQDNTFCCLGVLAHRICTKVQPYENGAFVGFSFKGEDFIGTIAIPEFLISFDQQGTLTVMNDCADKSFAEIADWIEANIEATND